MRSLRLHDLRLYAVGTFLAISLTGCGSSPSTHFYTLDPVQGRSPRIQARQSVQITAVHVSATLDRREMVRETAPNRLDVNGQNQWAAPLDEMMRRVLSQDMAQRLPKGAILAADEPATGKTKRVVVAVSQFERDPSGAVVLDGSWSLLAPGEQEPVLARDFQLRQRPGGETYADDAASMSSLVGRLADNIASALQ